MAKKFLLYLTASLFSFCLFAMVVTASLAYAVRASHIKSWLRQSGVYTTGADEILMQTNNVQVDQTRLSPQDPVVQVAVHQAFTPAFIQSVSEQFVDGTFHWLNGAAPKPDFAISTTPAKTAFANAIGNYLKTRDANLPVCGRDQATSTDPFRITCKPLPNFDVNAAIDQLTAQIQNSPDLLGSSQTITADSIKINDNGQTKPAFEQLKQLPLGYQWLQRAPYIFGLLVIVFGAIVIFGSSTRWRGSKRLMLSLISTALLLAIYAVLSIWGMGRFGQQIDKSLNSSTKGFQTSILNVIKLANHDVMKVNLIFAAAFIVLALLLLVVHIIGEKRHPEKQADDTRKEPIKESVA